MYFQLDRKRRYVTLLLPPRSSSDFDFMHKQEKNKFIWLHIRISKHLFSSQYLFNKGIIVEIMKEFKIACNLL